MKTFLIVALALSLSACGSFAPKPAVDSSNSWYADPNYKPLHVAPGGYGPLCEDYPGHLQSVVAKGNKGLAISTFCSGGGSSE